MIFQMLIKIIYFLLTAYGGIMSLGIILSWVPGAFEIGFFKQIRNIGDWYLGTFRGRLVIGMIDFTPLIGLIIYSFILNLLSIWI
ncbi:MAG TPA: YggT family protein [Bacilli bacterium]